MSDLDILARIDAAVGCQQCGDSLDGSVSDDFCDDWCQQEWHEARAVPLTHYVEPVDLPVHVNNLVELHSPEVSAWPRFQGHLAGAPAHRHFLNRVVQGTVPLSHFVLHANGQITRNSLNRLTLTIQPDFGALIAALSRAALGLHRLSAAWRNPVPPEALTRPRPEATPRAPYVLLDEVVRPRMGGIVGNGGLLPEQLLSGFREAWPPKPETDSGQARALDHVRNRNTGPTMQQRAPRQVNPRGSARRR